MVRAAEDVAAGDEARVQAVGRRPAHQGPIRQLRQARMKKRMMASVPKASVIITNPTHYAVALSYERGMSAPICVAKGTDLIALKIREIAKEHDIPIVENVPLARALHASRGSRRRNPGGALSCGRRGHRLRHGPQTRTFRPAGMKSLRNRTEMACDRGNNRLMDLRLAGPIQALRGRRGRARPPYRQAAAAAYDR